MSTSDSYPSPLRGRLLGGSATTRATGEVAELGIAEGTGHILAEAALSGAGMLPGTNVRASANLRAAALARKERTSSEPAEKSKAAFSIESPSGPIDI